MLWLTFIAQNICKDVSKDPLQPQDTNELVQTHTKPTILRFYLLSDGIPLIIVGVTAAFGMDNYGSTDEALYCWMAWEPSLGGFYIPMTLLFLVMSMYFLSTYIKLKRHPERKYELRLLSEEQQQLSSSEANQHCQMDTGGTSGPAGDCPPFAPGVSVLVNEHSFKSQLRATAFTLFLFLATWALGGLAVSLGHFLDMIFSCLYGAFCVTLGLFLLIQHCAKRDDVWHCWWSCCPSKSTMENGNGVELSQNQGLHPPHSHQHSPCSGKQPLFSPLLVQSSYQKMTSPSQSPITNHTGACSVAVMSPGTTTFTSPLTDPMASIHPQSLPDDLPHLVLPLHSCLTDRTKSRSSKTPRLSLQDYQSHMTSVNTDESVHTSHIDSLHAAHHLEGSTLVSKNPNPDLQLTCLSPHLDKQLVSCQSLQCQTSCHSVQDSLASCSCHSLLPSHRVHTCNWHQRSSADHSSNTSFSQYQQNPDASSSMSKITDKEKAILCEEQEQKGFPRNTLPRQHASINIRGSFSRNRSLQEDNLLGLAGTRNLRTGRWMNETTV
ncbi:adhesion G protein-coupled receptor A1 [Echeneis naucrates]|uniref:adhesion G protein-coupled receptor A1 n=1 Tax=Echeneis naucrates TaxID=173247 RepID=UPI001113FE36|nr:adhesion G protein-coupled receptor A1-like [Echeneis naucrates]